MVRTAHDPRLEAIGIAATPTARRKTTRLHLRYVPPLRLARRCHLLEQHGLQVNKSLNDLTKHRGLHAASIACHKPPVVGL